MTLPRSTPCIQSPRPARPDRTVVAAITLALAIPLAACDRLGSSDPTPAPTPFMPVAGVEPLGETGVGVGADTGSSADGVAAGPTPGVGLDLAPTATALVATLTAMAASGSPAVMTTPGAGAPAAGPTVTPPGAGGAAAWSTEVPPLPPSDLVACPIVTSADIYALSPAPEAPEAARTEWAARAAAALTAAVEAYDEDLRIYRLRAVEPAAEYPFFLIHTGEPLPVEPGRTYRFTAHNDVPGAPPAGAALRIDDVEGGDGAQAGATVFLGLSVRETDGAAARLLGGDRAGFALRQLPTRCLPGGIDACGFELRAAPVEVRRGEPAVTVAAGETGVLASDPPYQVRVLSSHYRRWLGNAPCPDPTDWVLAVRISRGAAATTAP